MNAVRTMLSALALTAVAAGSAHGQLGLEVRGGAMIPSGDGVFAEEAATGYGFEASIGLALMPMVELYGGVSWARFGLEDDGIVDAEFTDSGIFGGARIVFDGDAVQPWVRGGVIYNTLEAEGDAGISFSGETDRVLGFEVGGGVGLNVSPTVTITPGVRYRSYSPTFDVADVELGSFDVNYIAVDIGVRIGI